MAVYRLKNETRPPLLRAIVGLTTGIALTLAGGASLVAPARVSSVSGVGPPDLFLLGAMLLIIGIILVLGMLPYFVKVPWRVTTTAGAMKTRPRTRALLRRTRRDEDQRVRTVYRRRPRDLSWRGAQFWLGSLAFHFGPMLLVAFLACEVLLRVSSLRGQPWPPFLTFRAFFVPIFGRLDWMLTLVFTMLALRALGDWLRERACAAAGLHRPQTFDDIAERP